MSDDHKLKNLTLVALSTVLSLSIVIAGLRLFAPHLLGMSPGLELVSVQKEAPPFFEITMKAPADNTLNINDPFVRLRGNPLIDSADGFGPHDILGFRNQSVPRTADLVVVGDSQIYGLNVPLSDNIPSKIQSILKNHSIAAYNISVAGWGPNEYLYAFEKALSLRPRIAVIAFYTGNDALDAFFTTYGDPHWSELIPDKSLTKSDAPEVHYPAPPEEMWQAQFKNGYTTTFTPALRLAANMDHPAVKAGYKILTTVAEKISILAEKAKVQLFFTIIPSKELAFSNRMHLEAIRPPTEYIELVKLETFHISELKNTFEKIKNVTYVDSAVQICAAADSREDLYPRDGNGHPLEGGYDVIARTLAYALNDTAKFAKLEEGAVGVKDGEKVKLGLIKNHQLWWWSSVDVMKKHGFSPDQAKIIEKRDIAEIELAGEIE